MVIDEHTQKFVDDEEILNRLISSPADYDPETHQLSPDAFSLTHKNEGYCSVSRERILGLQDAIEFGRGIRHWRDGSAFYGAASLVSGQARRHPRIKVVSKYHSSHEDHAGIEYYYDDGSLYKTGKQPFQPTPKEILPLLTYLTHIVTAIYDNKKDSLDYR